MNFAEVSKLKFTRYQGKCVSISHFPKLFYNLIDFYLSDLLFFN